MTARDGFEAYYFHKLKSWVPEVYWNNDFGTGSLEAMLRAWAERVAEMRREMDRVWTASSIEMADEWAVPFIGDLVGAEPLSAQNARANRVTAANMTSYYKRKTTRYLLDQFITDIVGTEGYVREIERWLARPPHELDMGEIRFAPLTHAPLGGTPNLTAPRADDAALPAFDEFARLPDFGPRIGLAPSFDYTTLHLNLFPAESYRLDMVTPFWLDDTRLTLDPSGRAVPLFHSASFDHRLGEWPIGPEEFPLPMRCARFNDAQFAITADGLSAIGSPALTTALEPWIGVLFPTRQDFRRNMESRLSGVQFNAFFSRLLRHSMVPDSAKVRQIEDDLLLDVGPFADTRSLDDFEIVAANLENWMAPADWPDRAELLVDVALGTVQFEDAPDPLADPAEIFHPRFHHTGLIHRIGAGGFARESDVDLGPAFNDANTEVPFTPGNSGLEAIRDNRRHVWQWNAPRRHNVSGNLTIEAADRTRPYLLSRTDVAGFNFTLNGTAAQENHLVIDGIWLGMMRNAVAETPLTDADDPVPPIHARLVLDGTFETVTLRHVTIDPGGEQVRLDPLQARAIPGITLELEGSVKTLRIESSIIGPLVETRADPSLLNAGEIRVTDSVIQSIDPERPAISTELGRLYLNNCTVLGACHANLIFATNTLFDGPLYVTNKQQSCLRFSAVAGYETSVDPAPSALPRRFECTYFQDRIPPSTFQSTRFGDPDFVALSPLAHPDLLTGGEHRTEIGVGNIRFWNQRRDDLSRFVAKFLPVEQNAQIYEEIGA